MLETVLVGLGGFIAGFILALVTNTSIERKIEAVIKRFARQSTDG